MFAAYSLGIANLILGQTSSPFANANLVLGFGLIFGATIYRIVRDVRREMRSE